MPVEFFLWPLGAFGGGVVAGAICAKVGAFRWVLAAFGGIATIILFAQLAEEAGDWFLVLGVLLVGVLLALSVAFWPGFAFGCWLAGGDTDGTGSGPRRKPRRRSFSKLVPSTPWGDSGAAGGGNPSVPIVPRDRG